MVIAPHAGASTKRRVVYLPFSGEFHDDWHMLRLLISSENASVLFLNLRGCKTLSLGKSFLFNG